MTKTVWIFIRHAYRVKFEKQQQLNLNYGIKTLMTMICWLNERKTLCSYPVLKNFRIVLLPLEYAHFGEMNIWRNEMYRDEHLLEKWKHNRLFTSNHNKLFYIHSDILYWAHGVTLMQIKCIK